MNWPIFILSCVTAILVVLAMERLLRWNLSRRMDRAMRETFQQIKDGTYKSEAEPSPFQLSWEEDQITIADSRSGETRTICWERIRSASAYKLDLVAYDQVCVALELDNDTSIEIDETMDGFSDLMEIVPEHLPGFVAFTDWYMNITTPAFETNLTPLFERPKPGEARQQNEC